MKRMAVIVNPRGGRRQGLQVLNQIRPELESAGASLDIYQTEHSGHATAIAGSLELDRLDALAVIGGDGTFHEVTHGLLQRTPTVAVPIGIIPAGSGNTLAEHLGCRNPRAATRAILGGVVQPLDVIRTELSDRVLWCTNIVGWGAVSDINLLAERLRYLGPSRYSLAALWNILRHRRRRAVLVLDGQPQDDDFLFVIACNARFTGAGMMLAPAAKLDDGKADVVLVRRASRWQMLTLFSKVFSGTHTSLDFVEFHQVRSFSIMSADPSAMNLDGEMKGLSPVKADVIPGALRVFAPAP